MIRESTKLAAGSAYFQFPPDCMRENFLLRNLLPVTLGNILGGAGLGSLFWYYHDRKQAQVNR